MDKIKKHWKTAIITWIIVCNVLWALYFVAGSAMRDFGIKPEAVERFKWIVGIPAAIITGVGTISIVLGGIIYFLRHGLLDLGDETSMRNQPPH